MGDAPTDFIVSSGSADTGATSQLAKETSKSLRDAADGSHSATSVKSLQACESRQDLVCKDGSRVNDAAEIHENVAPTDVSFVSACRMQPVTRRRSLLSKVCTLFAGLCFMPKGEVFSQVSTASGEAED